MVRSASMTSASEAGVKKGSFYHFFPGKNELLAAAFTAAGESMRPEYDRIFSPSLPPVDRLRRFFKFVLEKQIGTPRGDRLHPRLPVRLDRHRVDRPRRQRRRAARRDPAADPRPRCGTSNPPSATRWPRARSRRGTPRPSRRRLPLFRRRHRPCPHPERPGVPEGRRRERPAPDRLPTRHRLARSTYNHRKEKLATCHQGLRCHDI